MGKKKSILGKLLQSKVIFAILIIITVISCFRLSREISRRMKISNEIQELRTQTAQLQSQRDSLSQLIQRLGTNAYVEEELRKKLNRAKEGETLIIIPDQAAADDGLQTSQYAYPIPY